MSRVLGIDPSLTSTGVAFRYPNGRLQASCVQPIGLKGLRRVAFIRDSVLNYVESYKPDVVAIEGYAFSYRGASNTLFNLGELGGVLRLSLLEKGIRLIVVPPTSLKLFATGRGNAAGKDAVKVALLNELAVSFKSSDQNDAAWLLLLGETYLGYTVLRNPSLPSRLKAMGGCEVVENFCS